MLKVKYNPEWHDDPKIRCAIQYNDEQFSELSKVWAERGFELLVHKQEVDPLIDIIQRGEDDRIVDAMTIGVGDWFMFDPEDRDDWYVVSDKGFSEGYVVVEEEAPHAQS